MRCLIVKAHPLTESLCSSMTLRVVEALRANGHEVWLSDLYEDGFEAAMTPMERASYYKGPYLTESVADQIAKLQSAEAIVLLFPTWWFGFPAILKGWFDRVWAPGVAYDHVDGFGPIAPGLHNLREMLAVTSLGAPWWVDWIVMRQPVKRILKTALVRACAPKSRFQMVSIYQSESLTSIQVEKYWSRIHRALSKWKKPK